MKRDERLWWLEFGMRMALIRHIKKLSQDQLCKRLSISRASIANIETGRQGISAYMLRRLAKALGVSVGQLLPAARAIGRGEGKT